MLFVESEQSFDTINKAKLINLSRMTVNETRIRIKVHRKETEEFVINRGARQGDSFLATHRSV